MKVPNSYTFVEIDNIYLCELASHYNRKLQTRQ